MSEPFIAEIRIFAGNFAPRGWAFCDGQLLPIANNTALFSLIGTVYGGDGRTTTALPNLQGRAPMHPGAGPGLSTRQLGQKTGMETVSLTQANLPPHTHTLNSANSTGSSNLAPSTNTALANVNPFDKAYQSDSSTNIVNMSPSAIGTSGGSQAHNNMQPFLSLNFIIALTGLYPSRS